MSFLRDLLSIIEGWIFEFLSIEFVKIPLDKMLNILVSARLYASEQFDPNNNKGFVLMFTALVYPLLWMQTAPSALVQVFLLPAMMFYYLIDPSIFIDQLKTIDDPKAWNRPLEGLPTDWASNFSMTALLWFDFGYFGNWGDLQFDMSNMTILFFFSHLQLVLSFLLALPIAVWSLISGFSLYVLYLYETLVLENGYNGIGKYGELNIID